MKTTDLLVFVISRNFAAFLQNIVPFDSLGPSDLAGKPIDTNEENHQASKQEGAKIEDGGTGRNLAQEDDDHCKRLPEKSKTHRSHRFSSDITIPYDSRLYISFLYIHLQMTSEYFTKQLAAACLTDVLLDTIQGFQQIESDQRLGGEGQGHDPGCHGPMIKESSGTHVIRWLHTRLHDSSNADRGNHTRQRHQGQLG